ncbi:MAG: hypothetical protein LBG77_01740 [Dysgonamonadaceae bacterium]|jgi:phage terminase large subunit-like protein|nr:hypothetical protein [Dysgonamonadaceae bacterium]
MTIQERKELIERWQQRCEVVQSGKPAMAEETPVQKQQRIRHLLSDYNAFVRYYFAHWCTDKKTGEIIPSAKFHIEAAKYLLKNKDCRAVFKWARGHAKSTHMDVFIPMWLKAQREREINVMVLVGKSEDSSITLLSDLQAELQYNERYIADFGKQIKAGNWIAGEFVTADDCAFFARGRGQSPRGLRYRDKRPDYIVIDDLDDDELCQSESRVRILTDWVKTALFGCFGAQGGRFIMVGNLIAKNSVLANIAAIEGVHVTQVNVWNKNGNPSWPELWKPDKIRERELFMGYRAFQKEYMNNPITEGAIFKNDWIHYGKAPEWREFDHIVAYCDPSFKGTKKNDYKAIKVWGKKGTELWNLKNFVRQASVSEMVRWFYDLHENMQAAGAVCYYYMEANFIQDLILEEFTSEGNLRGYQLPIRADKRKKPEKIQRIESISPLWERGFVWYDERLRYDRDSLAGLEQLLAVEKGSHAHDDAPDADEGAIWILQQRTRRTAFQPVFGRDTNNYVW